MRNKNPRDLPLCVPQYIIDHPDMTPARVAEAIDVSHATAHRLRAELGFLVRRYETKPAKELIAAQCGWDVAKTAAELERAGHDVTTRQVMDLCGQAPWSRRQVQRNVEDMKRRRVRG